ncbi:MAG: 1-acyl-sn-glycerol-3-phosphate acyltransferase [Deltaproteobacteria bacterium]|nr:1-acyl-sn-glycerol-3-phosphate acyltransferase [Deltaproteobacteria bacterium]
MLDLERLKHTKLSRTPVGQLLVANLVLSVDYRFPRRTTIVLEGTENIPRGRGVFFAMNHTDRYNYWPFQYQLYRQGFGFTATWVKGKYFEHPFNAGFLSRMNSIPLPSRGYLITTEFRKAVGRVPDDAEYRWLREAVNGRPSESGPSIDEIPDGVRPLLEQHGPDAAALGAWFNALFRTMMTEVVRLNRQALEELGLHILVFPEGTRSKRLGPGYTGLAQMTQHLGATILPVGCNGSDRIYPGNSPFSKGGRVVYRVGRPLPVDGPELAPYRVPEHVVPSTEDAEQFEDRYRAITDVVMARISELLDEEYRAGASTAVKGAKRFV